MFNSNDHRNEDPFFNEGNSEDAKKECKGILYKYYLVPKYKLTRFIWGDRAVQEPETFNQTGSAKFLFYGFFFLKTFIIRFFKGPQKGPSELDFIQKISLLLDTEDNSYGTLQKCREFTHLHRLHENTKARQRLEKWASKLIVVYLFLVFLLVLGNYIAVEYTGIFSFMNKVTFEIPHSVIITLLSTTTVNIIGLGFIMLRGHFLSKSDVDGISWNVKPRTKKDESNREEEQLDENFTDIANKEEHHQ